MGYALGRYGTMPLADVLEPAIRLASEGFPISPFQVMVANLVLEPLAANTAARFMLDADRRPLPSGARLRQPVLASTLRQVAAAGVADFYRGDIARSIVRDMKEHGGLVSADDLAELPPPLEQPAMAAPVIHGTAHALPPPGGAVTLLQQLLLFEQLEPAALDPDSPEAAVLFAALGHRAEVDRTGRPAPPVTDAAAELPEVLTPSAIAIASQELQRRVPGSSETSHLSVIDRWGNAVAQTQSLNLSFGAKCAAPDLGFLYNCYLGDLNTEDPRHPYYLRPGAAARSNAARRCRAVQRHPHDHPAPRSAGRRHRRGWLSPDAGCPVPGARTTA
jgi:gamma-glutamyltranspeptidase/glutathione hydrolase